METEEPFPSLLRAGIFSKAMKNGSSCCLSSFNCKSNLPPYGSLQETSTRIKREIYSHGDSGALWKIGAEFLGINYRKQAHTSSQSPSEGNVLPNGQHRGVAEDSFSMEIEKGFMVESIIAAEFPGYECHSFPRPWWKQAEIVLGWRGCTRILQDYIILCEIWQRAFKQEWDLWRVEDVMTQMHHEMWRHLKAQRGGV